MIENTVEYKTAQEKGFPLKTHFTCFSQQSYMISMAGFLDPISHGNFVSLDKLGMLKFSTKCEIWENCAEVIYGWIY